MLRQEVHYSQSYMFIVTNLHLSEARLWGTAYWIMGQYVEMNVGWHH